MNSFLLYYRYNLILFLEPFKKRAPAQAELFSSKNSRFQAQREGPYNPFVLCRTFIVFLR